METNFDIRYQPVKTEAAKQELSQTINTPCASMKL
jgi:hypothetical protein